MKYNKCYKQILCCCTLPLKRWKTITFTSVSVCLSACLSGFLYRVDPLISKPQSSKHLGYRRCCRVLFHERIGDIPCDAMDLINRPGVRLQRHYMNGTRLQIWLVIH